MATTAASPINFFISYAHEDEDYKNKLMTFLKPLIRQKQIVIWNDNAILAGQKWNDEINEALDKSEVVLLLLSVDFFASDYINEVEIKKALEAAKTKSKIIVPILLRDCDTDSFILEDDPDTKLSNYQGLPAAFKPVKEWPDQDQAWMSVLDGLKKLIAYIKQKK